MLLLLLILFLLFLQNASWGIIIVFNYSNTWIMFQEWSPASILRNNTYEVCLLIVYHRIFLTIDLDVSKDLDKIADRQCVYHM